MASLNRVILMGNLTRDPELRSTPSGASVATLGLAVNRRWTSKEGERKESTDFFNIVVWAAQAERCSQYLKKGSPIAVDGRLQSRSWETAEGQKRSTVEVVAENVQFLSRRETSDTFGSASPSPSNEARLPASEGANDEGQTSQAPSDKNDVISDEAPF